MANVPRYREELRSLLKSIFDPGLKWGENQIKSYELLRHYINTYRLRYLTSNQSRDKYIIVDNLQQQPWYRLQGASVNSIITSLIDQMKITREESLDTDLTKLLNLVVDFRHFQLHCYYYQQVGELVSLQIFIVSNDQRNYLAYNIKGNITVIPQEIREKIGVPELSYLNEQTQINEAMISAETLMKFFLEVILYYDETETISGLKLSQDDERPISTILETVQVENSQVYHSDVFGDEQEEIKVVSV